jgi:hypothetical protein
MTTEDIAALEAQIYAYVGRECGSSTAKDPVNKAMIKYRAYQRPVESRFPR